MNTYALRDGYSSLLIMQLVCTKDFFESKLVQKTPTHTHLKWHPKSNENGFCTSLRDIPLVVTKCISRMHAT